MTKAKLAFEEESPEGVKEANQLYQPASVVIDLASLEPHQSLQEWELPDLIT